MTTATGVNGVLFEPARATDDQAAELRRLVARAGLRPLPRAEREVLRPAPAAPVIAIASGKGGVGKTTLAVNAAIWLHRRRRTLLVDADLGTANADVLCGLAPSRRLDSELFRGDGPDLASLRVTTPWGFGLIPGAAGVAHAAMLDAAQRAGFIASLHRLGDPGGAVLVDLGAGIAAPVVESVASADLGVVVTAPEPTALADAYALIKCVTRHRGDERPLRIGLVVNMADSRSAGQAAHERIDRVCRRFLGGAVPLLGVIRRDRRASMAAASRVPLAAGWPRTAASRDLRRVAEMIGAVTPRIGRSFARGGQP